MDKQNRNIEICYGKLSFKEIIQEILKKQFIENLKYRERKISNEKRQIL